MKISIIGTGYVGLPTACAFAKWGHKVICIDNNQEKIEKLSKGEATIYEKGLQQLLDKVGKNILFTTECASMAKSDVVLLTVGTPMSINGEADLTYIFQAAEQIKEYAPKAIVIIKSTVPVGTCAKVSEILPKATIISMPEFLREGFALEDLFNPDRIIIGLPKKSNYLSLERKISPIYPKELRKKIEFVYGWESSELIKYASNAFLAVKIHFINEIADLCEQVGADVGQVANGMGLDSRIGWKFLQAGIGYGGSCFPKDTNALFALAENNGVRLSLVESAILGNKRRQKKFAKNIDSIAGAFYGENARIAILGLAFKAGTDDVRESPAITLINSLKHNNIAVYDPMAMENAKKVIKKQDIIYCKTMKSCIKDSDIIVIATDWDEFYAKNFPKAKGKKPFIYDLRNMNLKSVMEGLGYYYKGVGYGE